MGAPLGLKQNDWKKSRIELHNNAKWCFKNIQEAETYKTIAIRLLTSHLTNYPSKMSRSLMNKYGRIQKRRSMDSYTRTHQYWPTSKIYIQPLHADTGCCLDNTQKAMSDRGGWRERVKGICTVGLP